MRITPACRLFLKAGRVHVVRVLETVANPGTLLNSRTLMRWRPNLVIIDAQEPQADKRLLVSPVVRREGYRLLGKDDLKRSKWSLLPREFATVGSPRP